MASVYILQSLSTQQFNVGSTNDLPRRLAEHERGHSLATRGRGPWNLVYQEGFPQIQDARRRELEIKRWKSAKMVRALISGPVS
jgi:putative endonuclease